MKKVSIVVLNWNGSERLHKCLQSLNKVSYSPLEVIVVDNNSHDGSQTMVNKKFPWVKLIQNRENKGYSGGNNVGIQKSTGEYVFILNNDTEVTKDFLSPLVDILDKNPRVGCVQPKLLYGTDHNLLNAVGSYLTATGFLYHYGYRKNASLKKYNVPMLIYSAKGAAMLLRKSVLNKVGLFDEDFFIFFEETDLCHRLWLAGFKVMYEPKSIVYHFEAVDTGRQMGDYTRNYLSLRNRVCSYLKNLEALNLFKILSILFLVYAASFIYYSLRLRFDLSFAVTASIVWNIRQFPNTLKKRYNIQNKIRKIKDAELFKTIKKDPPLRYYYYLFFDNLKNFQNEKFI